MKRKCFCLGILIGGYLVGQGIRTHWDESRSYYKLGLVRVLIIDMKCVGTLVLILFIVKDEVLVCN